ncbi:MAG: hypothetical protein AUJ92_08275 [Armatimonadetes bacterium CG2_30_59_28]|nr:hypothetical protein [Armatimonadota bacterium]OIO95230.1 MAG: hypothetical protein AUJ92_08275 [Armatimonadetes bacterium CG2_30_59_28]PIU66962.1 MAG: hypothetical protein COS85_02480 [Armatimonadetes bacterium CG07_land_8_20_14_0_80_59_28]PIY43758.1 MAG: hypothetical protein COZ05_10080 [Armatimonadetes bacterium CG_4_10_14_3_um_filter_59_10]
MDGTASIIITSPQNGDILNHLDGEQAERGLLIEVTGTCPSNAEVRVNGRNATVRGAAFKSMLLIVNEKTRIRACVGSRQDDPHDDIQVLWDRNCLKRYRFSTDDNIWFLRDIAQNADTYKSIFDNPYLALWKRLRDLYGTSVQHNIYWQDEADFELPRMPDKFRAEWQDNAHWLKLAYHALANEPAYPHENATYEDVARVFEDITSEIIRFAGEEVLTSYTTLHWGRASREACRAVRDRGIRGLACPFPDTWPVDPHIAYYLPNEVIPHAQSRDYWWDAEEDLIFIAYDINCNGVAAADIPGRLAVRAADPHHSQLMEVMIHEQYFYPDYRAYLPDYADRVETCVRWLTEAGYRSVQHDDGFLGA